MELIQIRVMAVFLVEQVPQFEYLSVMGTSMFIQLSVNVHFNLIVLNIDSNAIQIFSDLIKNI